MGIMYKYEIEPGSEHVVFGGDGVRNNGDGTVESDHELTSALLSLIADEPAQAPALPAPIAPAAPQLPAQTQPTQGDAS